MSDKRIWKIDNFKVVVDVTGQPWVATNPLVDEGFKRDHAEDLAKIVRALTETLSKHYVNVRVDAEKVCRFCGHNWEAALDERGNPICCESAIDMQTELAA